jgi:hypothetical protein
MPSGSWHHVLSFSYPEWRAFQSAKYMSQFVPVLIFALMATPGETGMTAEWKSQVEADWLRQVDDNGL